MKSVKKWGVALVAALATSSAAVVAAVPAHAVTTPAPAITNDPNASNGTLSFYDSTGAVVTSGTSLSHLFTYAAASSAGRDGATKATVYFSFPDHTQTDSQNWFTDQTTASTNYPVTGAPSSITSLTTPVATARASDANLGAELATTTQDHTAGYDGIVQVRLYDSGPGKPLTSTFWASDIYYDATANTWQQVFPAVSGPVATKTTLSASPAATTTGKTVTLTATVSPTAAGSVQFVEGATTIGTADVSSSGSASVTTGALTTGTHTYKATFTPSDATAFGASSGQTSVTVSTPAPDKSSLTIGRAVTVTYGKTTKVTGTLTDTTTRKAIAGAAVTLYLRHSATGAWARSSVVHSTSAGAVAVTVKPTAKTYYQWRYAGSTTHAAATSASVTVSVKQTATVHATPAKITHGRTLKIWGSVSPSASGRKVTLQRKSGATYRSGASVTTKKQKLPNGKTGIGYVVTVKLATKGSYVYRVVVAATSTLVSGTSSTVTVKAV